MNPRKIRMAQQFKGNLVDLERTLVDHILNTGKEQIKKRRKAGLSVYFLKDGRIVEVTPNRTEIKGKKIESRWINLDREKRTLVLK